MAVGAEAALNNLDPKLRELILRAEDYNLPKDVRASIMFMLDELQSVRRAFEHDVQADEQFELWAKDATALFVSLDGLVDIANHSLRTVAIAAGLKGSVAKISIISKMKTKEAHRQFAREFEDVKRLFDELNERRRRYRIDSNILPTRHRHHLPAPDVKDSSDGSEKVEITAVAAKLVAELAVDAGKVYQFRSKVKGAMCFVQRELEHMEVALRIIATVPTDELDEGTKAWAEDMKDVSCDIKDAVDNFISSKARRKFFSDMCDLKQQILEVAERRRRYNNDAITSAWRRRFKVNISDDSPSDSIVGAGLPPDPLQHPRSLVAIEGPRDALAKLLTDEGSTSKSNQQLKIVSVVGVAGVGKTTLVKAVYDSIAAKFDSAAWVRLSCKPNIRKALVDLLHQLSLPEKQSSQDDQHDKIEALDERQLVDEIRESLVAKRYLVVIDDIWDLKSWEILKCALTKNSNGSAVLTTTRISNVAECVGQVYRLQPLSESYSRSLFYDRLFGSEDECPSELADISTKLIAKCRGVPLAIISTASVLGVKSRTVESWQPVYDSVGYYELEQGENNVRRILAISYDDLPRHLKLCLLYFSMFQKGYMISGERLVWAWIAEGFIQEAKTHQERRALREVGEMCLNELTNRNLIESMQVDSGSMVYRVYDMVHDLIISLSTEENFATILDGRRSRSFPDTVHRLSIHGNGVGQRLPQVPSHVRSLVVSGDAKFVPTLSDLHELRILDLGGCDSLQNDHLKGIEKSIFLKYLVIGGNCVTSIPNEISSLLSLQTLDLRASGLKEMPASILKCTNLERLCVSGNTKIPDGIGEMKALKELGDINISNPELLKELSKLVNLTVLKICIWSWDESYHDGLLGYLRSLVENSQRNIQSLHIFTCSSIDFIDKLDAEFAPFSLQQLEIRYSSFLALPSWILLLHKLSSLSIEVHKLSLDIINFFGMLPSLRSLSLISKYAPEQDAMFGTGTHMFENLTNFYFVSNTMTKVFGPEREVMHRLKELKLSFHVSQTEDVNEGFSFGLEDLCSLEKVSIEIICFDASRRTVERAEAAIRQAVFSGRILHPNLDIRRVEELYMIESEVIPNVQQEQKKQTEKYKSTSSSGLPVIRERPVYGGAWVEELQAQVETSNKRADDLEAVVASERAARVASDQRLSELIAFMQGSMGVNLPAHLMAPPPAPAAIPPFTAVHPTSPPSAGSNHLPNKQGGPSSPSHGWPGNPPPPPPHSTMETPKGLHV